MFPPHFHPVLITAAHADQQDDDANAGEKLPLIFSNVLHLLLLFTFRRWPSQKTKCLPSQILYEYSMDGKNFFFFLSLVVGTGEKAVPCALLPPGGRWGEQAGRDSKEFFHFFIPSFFFLFFNTVGRLITSHPASKYRDCILGRFSAFSLGGKK